jgi:sec-independent protein translocase protein TatB
MFGMGLGEIIVIVIVALLFIGPEKLPEAAKSISKGIRDLRKQTRELRDTIEEDTEFGGAIRDLQSALRGDDLHASTHARQKAAALSKSPTLKPAPEASAAGTLPASAAGTTSGSAAAPVPAPVIAASVGAVARGGATEAAAPAAAGAEKQPGESTQAADSTSGPGRAHG